ncbi:MAG: bacillithiol system redox-active protein YtxJ [Chitinophagia bacterium]|nr:bacillithiol system redox-active protein YtxJ [Chitinophagia bacterium]
MKWIELTAESQLDLIDKQSHQQPIVIFKHSTRCSVSKMVESRLERANAPDNIQFYYLDLLTYRAISNAVANRYGVIHESPQVLLIINGKCHYHESQNIIYMEDLIEQANRTITVP